MCGDLHVKAQYSSVKGPMVMLMHVASLKVISSSVMYVRKSVYSPNSHRESARMFVFSSHDKNLVLTPCTFKTLRPLELPNSGCRPDGLPVVKNTKVSPVGNDHTTPESEIVISASTAWVTGGVMHTIYVALTYTVSVL